MFRIINESMIKHGDSINMNGNRIKRIYENGNQKFPFHKVEESWDYVICYDHKKKEIY